MADIVVSFSELLNGKYPIKLVGNDDDGYALATTADGGGNPLPSTSGKDGKILSVVGTTPTWTTPPTPITPKAIAYSQMMQAAYDKYIPIAAGFMNLGNSLFPGVGSFVANGGSRMPFAGTVKNLYVSSVAVASDGTDLIKIYVNGVASTLAVTVANLAKTGSDLTHSVAFNVGDYLSYAYIGGYNFTDLQVVVEIDPS